MLVRKIPKTGYRLNAIDTFKMSEADPNIESGSFLVSKVENGQGVAKVGSTATTDHILGFSLDGINSLYTIVVKEVLLSADKTINLNRPISSNDTLYVKLDGTKLSSTAYTVSDSKTIITLTGTIDFSTEHTVKVIYKTQKTVTEIQNAEETATNLITTTDLPALRQVNLGTIGEFCISNFDSSCDFENFTALKIDEFGRLTTNNVSGTDVTSKVAILETLNGNNNFLKVLIHNN